MKKLAVIVSGWHFPISFYEQMKEQKVPVLEPSSDCSECQYYERCFVKRKNSKQLSLGEMLGIGKKDLE